MSDGRRLYSELEPIEQAIVRASMSRERISRKEIIDTVSDEFDEEELEEAISTLRQENRFFRIGNQDEFVMIERDLF